MSLREPAAIERGKKVNKTIERRDDEVAEVAEGVVLGECGGSARGGSGQWAVCAH